MDKFIVLNKSENQNSTTTSIEVEASHADNVIELGKVQFNIRIPEEENTVLTDKSTVSSQLNVYEKQQANKAMTSNDEVEMNMQQSNKSISMYTKSVSRGCFMDIECHCECQGECQKMNMDTLAESNAIIIHNPCMR